MASFSNASSPKSVTKADNWTNSDSVVVFIFVLVLVGLVPLVLLCLIPELRPGWGKFIRNISLNFDDYFQLSILLLTLITAIFTVTNWPEKKRNDENVRDFLDEYVSFDSKSASRDSNGSYIIKKQPILQTDFHNELVLSMRIKQLLLGGSIFGACAAGLTVWRSLCRVFAPEGPERCTANVSGVVGEIIVLLFLMVMFIGLPEILNQLEHSILRYNVKVSLLVDAVQLIYLVNSVSNNKDDRVEVNQKCVPYNLKSEKEKRFKDRSGVVTQVLYEANGILLGNVFNCDGSCRLTVLFERWKVVIRLAIGELFVLVSILMLLKFGTSVLTDSDRVPIAINLLAWSIPLLFAFNYSIIVYLVNCSRNVVSSIILRSANRSDLWVRKRQVFCSLIFGLETILMAGVIILVCFCLGEKGGGNSSIVFALLALIISFVTLSVVKFVYVWCGNWGSKLYVDFVGFYLAREVILAEKLIGMCLLEYKDDKNVV